VNVEVVEYDDAWPARFTAEADQIRAALGAQLRRVEHVGSTAVPGLAAKPVVDIAVSIESFEALDGRPLETLGYVHQSQYDEDFPNRRYFRKPGFHVHVYEREHEEFMDYVRFRDYLRTHPEDADEYGALKRRIAGEHDSDTYRDAKAPFVERLVEMLRRGSP
jgi:GrpB-like predicted nucleotidyltransferase (UPF0157 family)